MLHSAERVIVGRKGIGLRLAVILSAIAVGVVIVSGWQRWSRRQQAHSLTTEAFRLVRQGRVPQIAEANTIFRRAIELDPKLAPAYAGLAEGMARSGEARPEQARAMAERALRLNANCAECKAIAGWIMMTREWRFQEALRYLDDAARQKPDDAKIRLWHAQILATAGRLERALEEINYAVSGDPSRAASVTMLAGILYLSERYEEAISTAREALGLQPGYSAAWDWIYRSCIRLNRVEEAVAARAALSASYLGLSADTRFEMEHGWTVAIKTGGVRALVETLLAETSAKPALDQHRYERATWRMWIGDKQGALDELENVFDFRPFHCIYLAVDPTFAPIRGERRFRQVLSKIGIERVLRN
jgi:tetratricopeptide (TPR) repeat protein